MANAPVVQSLAEIMAELAPGTQAQNTVIDQQRAALAPKYAAQKAGLTAEKGRGFDAISDQARGRGLAFSGVPLDEQATYLSTKYLPGLQAADAQMNTEDLALQGRAADIQADLSKTAFGSRQQQVSNLNSWNMQEASLAAQAEQARLSREASEREAAAQRTFTAGQNSLDRAATAANNASAKAANQANPIMDFQDRLRATAGSDGFVSPASFRAALGDWIALGGDNKSFMDKFWYMTGVGSEKYKNDKNRWKAYYG